MIGGPLAALPVPEAMILAMPGTLRPEELCQLWRIFAAIARTWGADGTSPDYQYSQWLEFIHTRTATEPSYLGEYRAGLEVLSELGEYYGESLWHRLFFAHDAQPDTRLAHLRKFVVEEFMQVWLTTGGFRTYGAGNYNSYVAGSRFAVTPPYRFSPSAPQAPLPQTSAADLKES